MDASHPRALNTTYPPRRSPLVIEGPPVPGAMDKSAVVDRKGSGPSRANGIEVPKVEELKFFTGKPEGPK